MRDALVSVRPGTSKLFLLPWHLVATAHGRRCPIQALDCMLIMY
jgi:hypothetical protein